MEATWEVALEEVAEAVEEEDMAGVMMRGQVMEAAAATWGAGAAEEEEGEVEQCV